MLHLYGHNQYFADMIKSVLLVRELEDEWNLTVKEEFKRDSLDAR